MTDDEKLEEIVRTDVISAVSMLKQPTPKGWITDLINDLVGDLKEHIAQRGPHPHA